MRGRQSRNIIFLDDNMYNDLDAYQLRAMSNTGFMYKEVNYCSLILIYRRNYEINA